MSLADQLADRASGPIDRKEFARLYAITDPAPVDVLNLIRFKNRNSYNVYGMMMVPTLKAIGGSIRWTGRHVQALSGEPQSEELIVVRYPMIRRFLQMAVNPLYLAVANPFRTRGVSHFEASFTTPDEPAAFDREPWIAVIHFNGDDSAYNRVRDIAVSAGGRYVYSSKEFSPVSILKKFTPTDPNPLRFKRVAFFAFPSQEDAARALTPAVTGRIGAATEGASVQLYRRASLKEFIPRFSR